jgi:hypothetical protein
LPARPRSLRHAGRTGAPSCPTRRDRRLGRGRCRSDRAVRDCRSSVVRDHGASGAGPPPGTVTGQDTGALPRTDVTPRPAATAGRAQHVPGSDGDGPSGSLSGSNSTPVETGRSGRRGHIGRANEPGRAAIDRGRQRRHLRDVRPTDQVPGQGPRAAGHMQRLRRRPLGPGRAPPRGVLRVRGGPARRAGFGNTPTSRRLNPPGALVPFLRSRVTDSATSDRTFARLEGGFSSQ